MGSKFDFSGWATKFDIKCADGRTIRDGAFRDNDGQTVPLVWQHQHNDPANVLGHALLEYRKGEGMYAYCTFNDTPGGQNSRELVRHGDVKALSIYANQLKQKAGDVIHGSIKEVSLVLAGANIGALIDFPVLAHSGEPVEDEAIIFNEEESFELFHSDDAASDGDEKKTSEDDKKSDSEDSKESEDKDKPVEGKSVTDVLDTLTDEQKAAVGYLIDQMSADDSKDNDEKVKHSDEGGSNVMKFNVFDKQSGEAGTAVLAHSDEMSIIEDAKKSGSFQRALDSFLEANELKHDDLAGVSGFTSYPSGGNPAGVDALFPEYHDVRSGAPELITENLEWVNAILRKTQKTPFSRIRTSQVDIRNIDALRAKGYEKGNKKSLMGNYSLARRTTDPQTVTAKSALNRDDIVDITDFDYVAYQYKIDRKQLEEELATAVLLGDGREEGADGKIDPTKIRPIWTDDDLYTIHKDLTGFMSEIQGEDTESYFGENFIYAEGTVAAILDAKIDYRGSGGLDMFATPQYINKMLLARDRNGRRIYRSRQELATELGVNNIYECSKMANQTRTKGTGVSAQTMKLDAILINLGDYSIGSTKGGEITNFRQFDIDFNQEKSLLETRVSGANTRVYSAIVLEESVESSVDQG